MTLSPQFLDELRTRTPMPALVGHQVKLRKAGRDWIGCCPFHNEKSPSFHVYDDHFHCYGCGAHGDAITFRMQTTGASFPEAVESLATEAGLEIPKPTFAQALADQRRLDLHEVLERAQQIYVARLHAREGRLALGYLRERGLSDETVAKFGLGWSGDGHGGLLAELQALGIDAGRVFEAGLLREAEDGSRRELYWDRVTFPIRDRRGRLISFGGRTLRDVKPKYINGPDTAIFHKRASLYALDLARAAVQSNHKLIVVEGYIDVIALHQARLMGAVAPLGTALTEEHLAELWRLSDAPVLCFDGDAAGARAVERSIMLALPLLRPGVTLQVATLPTGQDPDSLIRAGGSHAFETILQAALPLVDAIYATLAQGFGPGPEHRAVLRTKLDAAANAIQDRTLAAEFRTALRDRFFASRRRAAPQAGPARRPDFIDATNIAHERARLLTAILLKHPGVLRDVEEAFAGLDLPPDLGRLREHILHADAAALLDSKSLVAHLHQSGMAEQAAMVLSAIPAASSARLEAMPAEAEAEWWHIFGLMHRVRLEGEIAAARREFEAAPDQATQCRLVALCTALEALPDSDGDLGP